MKKILICLLTLLVLVGCGQKGDDNVTVDRPSADTLGGKLANAFFDEAEKTDNVVEIAEAIASKNYTEYNLVVAEVEPGWLNGFSNDITEFTSGVCFQPMIGTIPFVAYVFMTDNVEALTKQLEDNHDMRWNICTEAEEKVSYSYNNLVFFAMVPGEQ
ncbi:MAG: lipoprotein [Erysipelotrichaceae bacterium]